MTVSIPLTKGYVVTIDDCDADLAAFKWQTLIAKSGKIYAYRGNTDGKSILMHRVIMSRIVGVELERNQWVDHKDNCGLHNWRSNLRLATPTQNLQNQEKGRTKTGYKGVYSVKTGFFNPWKAQIMVNGKMHYLGVFHTTIDAHRAYCIAALTHFGQFANFGSNSPYAGWTLADFELPVKQLSLPLPIAA